MPCTYLHTNHGQRDEEETARMGKPLVGNIILRHSSHSPCVHHLQHHSGEANGVDEALAKSTSTANGGVREIQEGEVEDIDEEYANDEKITENRRASTNWVEDEEVDEEEDGHEDAESCEGSNNDAISDSEVLVLLRNFQLTGSRFEGFGIIPSLAVAFPISRTL